MPFVGYFIFYVSSFDICDMGNIMCKVHWFIGYTTPTISVWCLVAMTVNDFWLPFDHMTQSLSPPTK